MMIGMLSLNGVLREWSPSPPKERLSWACCQAASVTSAARQAEKQDLVSPSKARRASEVNNWIDGSSAAFDVTVTSPLTPVSLHESSITAGTAALLAEQRKHQANDPKCDTLGWKCIPLAVESYGNWGLEARQAVSHLASRLSFGIGHQKSKLLVDIYGRLNVTLCLKLQWSQVVPIFCTMLGTWMMVMWQALTLSDLSLFILLMKQSHQPNIGILGIPIGDLDFCTTFISHKQCLAKQLMQQIKEVILLGLRSPSKLLSFLTWIRSRPQLVSRQACSSPLNSLIVSEAGVSSGAAAHASEIRKHNSNDAKCGELGLVCIPLVVETYGAWDQEVVKTFAQLASRLAIVCSKPKLVVINDLYGRLNTCLIRSISSAILSRMVST
eukprot:Em0002g857a